MQKGQQYYGKQYRSGNALVDWTFRRLIWALNEKVRHVVLRTPLRDPDKPRKRLFGLWSINDNIVPFGNEKILYEEGVLYLDPEYHETQKEDMLLTLIHELSHIILASYLTEPVIHQIEHILFKDLSKPQKRALARHIPKKHETI